MKIDRAELDRLLEQKRQSLCLPSLSVAIVHNGEITLHGLGNAAPGRHMTSQTPLIIGSLSKSFTSLAIMQLVEAGKLSLDDPVKQHIPWFRLANPSASASITIRQLLSHTSGISRYAGRELLAGQAGKTIEQSARELAMLKLTKPVGTTFQYSNTNYLIAGLVVEVASGQSFETYLQQHIFAPLGMRHSHASERVAMQDGLASGYRWWFGLPIPYKAPYLTDAVPAAFIACSAEDLARYALAMLNSGSLDGVSILSPAGIAELQRPQAIIDAKTSYGLGWRSESLQGHPLIRHGGEVSNFRADLILLPNHKIGIVVLANANNGIIAQLGLDQIGLNVARILLDQSVRKQRLSFRQYYITANFTILLLSGLQCWAWIRTLKVKKQPQATVLGIGTLVDIIAPVAVLWCTPHVATISWRGLRLYVPDISSWLLLMLGLSLLRGFWRVASCLQAEREVKMQKREPERKRS